MSYREDFFRMLEGKTPHHDILSYDFAPNPAPGPEPAGVVMLMPSFSDLRKRMETGFDAWGLEYVWDSNKIGMIHKPGKYLLTDITKWRNVVKAPDMSGYDWAEMSKKDWEATSFNKDTQVSLLMSLLGGFFMHIVGFMGFEGALLAMHEEPEAVKEMFNYIADYECMMVENIGKYYKPDIINLGDDTATERSPFVSHIMFKELLLPFYKRVYDAAKKHGMIIAYHNCGKCDLFMDDMVGIGVQIWNCATPANDLAAFKKKHNNKVIIEVLPRLYPTFTEKEARQVVRDTIDAYAKEGAFVWVGFVTGSVMEDDSGVKQIEEWIRDEVKKYGKGFYSKQ